jgi:glycosyltransferase involved in cell wall biosynthesis
MRASVIFPARNEAGTIVKSVRAAHEAELVDEVIVADCHSTDNTAQLASNAGARVVGLPKDVRIGKGAAMRCGLKAATNDIIVFFDADILNIEPGMIQKLAEPIAQGEVDFVKGIFNRKGGRVTNLVAKPLLRMFFPEVSNFSQPLGGEIAGKREFFEQLEFEEGWGVDVGILLDAIKLNVRIKEVHIGFIDDILWSLPELQEMAQQVAVAILKRAKADGRLERL